MAHAKFEKYQETGNGLYLLQAIQEYGLCRLPIPFDVRHALGEVLHRYGNAEAWTLDDAFGVSRTKYLNQSSEQSKRRDTGSGYSKAYSIWRKVQELHEAGRAIDLELFAEVGQSHNVSPSTARKYYREVKRTLIKDTIS